MVAALIINAVVKFFKSGVKDLTGVVIFIAAFCSSRNIRSIICLRRYRRINRRSYCRTTEEANQKNDISAFCSMNFLKPVYLRSEAVLRHYRLFMI